MARNLPVVAQLRKRLRRKPKTLVRKVARLSKTVNRMRPEIKHSDLTNVTGTINNAGASTTRLDIGPGLAQGAGDFGQRVGDQITLRNLQVRGYFLQNAATTGNLVRCTIFVVKNNPDAAVGFTSLWNEYILSASDNTVYNVAHLKDWDNRGAFRTLYDKVWAINQDSATVTQKVVPFVINVPFKGMRMQFYNNTSTVSKNAVYCVFTSMTDDLVSVFLNARYTYTDA